MFVAIGLAAPAAAQDDPLPPDEATYVAAATLQIDRALLNARIFHDRGFERVELLHQGQRHVLVVNPIAGTLAIASPLLDGSGGLTLDFDQLPVDLTRAGMARMAPRLLPVAPPASEGLAAMAMTEPLPAARAAPPAERLAADRGIGAMAMMAAPRPLPAPPVAMRNVLDDAEDPAAAPPAAVGMSHEAPAMAEERTAPGHPGGASYRLSGTSRSGSLFTGVATFTHDGILQQVQGSIIHGSGTTSLDIHVLAIERRPLPAYLFDPPPGARFNGYGDTLQRARLLVEQLAGLKLGMQR